MKAEINFILISTAAVIVFGIVSSLIINATSLSATTKDSELVIGSWACRADEVQVCPDGTVVGRIPPYCHFAACN